MRVELTLETVTPLFLGGANQQPELRPASIRGALRFWLRAALGGVIGDSDLKRLAELEARVFGETERGSAVIVRLSQSGFTLVREPLLPHETVQKKAGITSAVPIDTGFDLILSLRPHADVNALEMATWSALLWVTLGGIGRRSRRGAGSLRIKKWSSEPENLLTQDLSDCLTAATTRPEDKQALADRIADLLDKARSAFTALARTTSASLSSGLPTFSILLPDTRVVVWTPPDTDLNDYKTVLTPLMNKMSSLKASLGNDFDDAFGGIKPRRASPLHATVHRLEKEWALTLTYFRAKIREGVNGNPAEVTKFLDSLPSSEKVEAYPRVPQGGSTP
jgi:CRISPR-associated protein Cmr1